MTIKRWAIGLGLVFSTWIALLAVVTVLNSEQKELLFIFPAQRTFKELPKDVAIIDQGSFWVTVKSNEPDLVISAYRAGVLLVLPAGLSGCFAILD